MTSQLIPLFLLTLLTALILFLGQAMGRRGGLAIALAVIAPIPERIARLRELARTRGYRA